MARPVIPASRVPTPGPWLVRGEAEPGADAVAVMLGVEPVGDDRPGNSYLIRQDRLPGPGGGPLHLAIGIQRLADAQLMAAAPDLAAIVLRLLVSPDLMQRDHEPDTCAARDAAWDMLVRIAPHLEIGP